MNRTNHHCELTESLEMEFYLEPTKRRRLLASAISFLKRRAVLVIIAPTSFLMLGLLLACAQTNSTNTTSRPRRVGAKDAKSVVVKAGGNLQEALNAAQFGDTIILEAGATFTLSSYNQSYVLPAKSGGTGTDADYIVVRSSRSELLPSGRVSPADRVNMAKIVARGFGGAFTTQNNSKYWKIVGLEITNSAPANLSEWSGDFNHVGTLVDIGNYQSGMANIWIDRCYIHPQEDGTTDYTRTVSHGVTANGVRNFSLTNSHVSGFMGEYQHNPEYAIDSLAFGSNVGDGYLIENNFLQAHYAPFFLGGGGTGTQNTGVVQASPAPTLTSATLSTVANLNVGDYVSFPQSGNPNANGRVLSINGNAITFTTLHRHQATPQPPTAGTTALWNGVMVRNAIFRRNTIDIDTANAVWEFENRGQRVSKGYFEVKHCDTCLFEGNIFQGWPSALAFNSVNQSGDAPWTVVKNLTFRNNWIKNFGTAFSMSFGNHDGVADGHMSAEGSNILIENNLFTQTNTLHGDYGITKVAIWGNGRDVTIRHNTFINNANGGGPMFASNGPIKNFVFTDNIAFNNLYGMNCGLGSFSACYPNWSEAKNVIVDNRPDKGASLQSAFPRSYIVASIDAVGFVDYKGANYRLSNSSRYKGMGTSGSNPGANIDSLMAFLGILNSNETVKNR